MKKIIFATLAVWFGLCLNEVFGAAADALDPSELLPLMDSRQVNYMTFAEEEAPELPDKSSADSGGCVETCGNIVVDLQNDTFIYIASRMYSVKALGKMPLTLHGDWGIIKCNGQGTVFFSNSPQIRDSILRQGDDKCIVS